MTAAAQDDEIFFAVRTQLAPPDHVVDLESIAPATVLAFPAVPVSPGFSPLPKESSRAGGAIMAPRMAAEPANHELRVLGEKDRALQTLVR